MIDGTTAQATELATPAIEKPAAETVVDDNEGFLPQVGDEEPETDETEEIEGEGDEETEEGEGETDTAEVELNGEKYKVPAALKDAFLMQADYTRKTQEVAEVRKTAEATNANGGRRGSSRVTTETLLANAAKGILPESDEDMQRLVKARKGLK